MASAFRRAGRKSRLPLKACVDRRSDSRLIGWCLDYWLVDRQKRTGLRVERRRWGDFSFIPPLSTYQSVSTRHRSCRLRHVALDLDVLRPFVDLGRIVGRLHSQQMTDIRPEGLVDAQ